MKQERIRLLHLIKSLDIGGIEKSTIKYSNALAENFGYIGIYARSAFYDQTNIVKNEIELIEPYKKISIINSISIFFQLNKIIREKKITHLHYHHRIYLPQIFLLKKKIPQLKIIYTHHNVFNDLVNKFLTANHFICVSEATKTDLLRWKRNIDIDVINHGVLVKDVSSKELYDHEFRIGYVGRFHKSKGLFILLNSFLPIYDKHKYLKLILKGSGSEKPSIVNYIKKNNLEKIIDILEPEWQEDRIYSDINLLVLPSQTLEGFGLVLIEAMNNGIPVIASDLPVIREIVEDYKNGLLFKTGDPISLRNKIFQLINNKKLRSEIGEQAKLTVKNKYNINRIVKEYLNLYIKF